MSDELEEDVGEQKCWTCDRPLGDTLDLTDDEIDALYEHLMETEQDADPYVAEHLSSILDKLPGHEILTRDPPAELRAELLIDQSITGVDRGDGPRTDGGEVEDDDGPVCPECGNGPEGVLYDPAPHPESSLFICCECDHEWPDDDGADHPTCDHRDHDEPVPAVAQYEGIEPPATAFRYWTCAEHEPETLTALKRIDPGQGNRSNTDTDHPGGDA